MKTILAPIDFSQVTRRVIDEAVWLARAMDAGVVLLHVVEPPAIVKDLAPLVSETLQFTSEIESGARSQLRQWQKRLAERGVTVETRCAQGSPVPLILANAKQLAAKYIVIGSHGHTTFRDLVFGGVASGVVKRGTCPVVVVPAVRERKKRPARTAR